MSDLEGKIVVTVLACLGIIFSVCTLPNLPGFSSFFNSDTALTSYTVSARMSNDVTSAIAQEMKFDSGDKYVQLNEIKSAAIECDGALQGEIITTKGFKHTVQTNIACNPDIEFRKFRIKLAPLSKDPTKLIAQHWDFSARKFEYEEGSYSTYISERVVNRLKLLLAEINKDQAAKESWN